MHKSDFTYLDFKVRMYKKSMCKNS